jgi:hypothetical protein
VHLSYTSCMLYALLILIFFQLIIMIANGGKQVEQHIVLVQYTLSNPVTVNLDTNKRCLHS